jgi:hypothetical protein
MNAIAASNGATYRRDSLVNGQPASIECVRIDNQEFVLEGKVLRVARLEDEWFDDLHDPRRAAEQLSLMRSRRPDLLTFWQRLPDVEPRHDYHCEWEDLAVLPVETYDRWWNQQIKSRVRNQIRKSQKEGLEVREAVYDHDFVAGMTAIFNEAPIRQGRPFWHYGKDHETVRTQFSRYLFRETLVGAYLGEDMLAFMMLADAGRFALTGQIIASLQHRDKSPSNALVAKAVELCAARGLRHLVYYFWTDDSLAEFKRRCGFEPVRVPRYYVPLTTAGRFALRSGLHHRWKQFVPPTMRERLKRLRRSWYAQRAGEG